MYQIDLFNKEVYLMYELDFEALKNQLKAEILAVIKSELETEQDVKFKEDEDTRQKQYNKQINYNILTQRQYQGQNSKQKTESESESEAEAESENVNTVGGIFPARKTSFAFVDIQSADTYRINIYCSSLRDTFQESFCKF